jgi:uncharacterized protein YbjT (DUF2867 family)
MSEFRRIAVAGVSGHLGQRIAKELGNRGIDVVALVRTKAQADQISKSLPNITPALVDYSVPHSLDVALEGAKCVVSALSGLSNVIIDAQTNLAEAAVRVGVNRFIPSDFSVDFRGLTKDGTNRNLDLRRTFQTRIDTMPIKATSILNGAFMDMLTGQMPVILSAFRRIFCVGDPTQKFDFTSLDDTARYTACAAIDEDAPRWLKIAGDQLSAQDLAELMTTLTGKNFRVFQPTSLTTFDRMITLTKFMTPKSNALYPPWQGMQYLRDMASGSVAMTNLDNNRYGQFRFRSAKDLMSAHLNGKEKFTQFS